MNCYAKDHWVPVDISLPDSNRMVQIQIAELPDATIGSYWSDNGQWIHGEKGYEALETITVLAWREMAESYKEEDEVLIFRSADEARILTFNALQRAKNGNLEKEFYEIVTKHRSYYELVYDGANAQNFVADGEIEARRERG